MSAQEIGLIILTLVPIKGKKPEYLSLNPLRMVVNHGHPCHKKGLVRQEYFTINL